MGISGLEENSGDMLFRNTSPTLTVAQRKTLLRKTVKDNSGSKHGTGHQNHNVKF